MNGSSSTSPDIQITVHCTVTRQQVRRPGYLEEFMRFWSDQTTVRQIWVSLYTPQVGENSAEQLTTADRTRVVADLLDLRGRFSQARHAQRARRGVRVPAGFRPDHCIFAKVTTCLSADLEKVVTPLPVRRQPRLRQLWVRRVRPAWRRSDATGCRVDFRSAHSSMPSLRVGARVRSAREAIAHSRVRRAVAP